MRVHATDRIRFLTEWAKWVRPHIS
jgi:hypothetical protein